MPAQVEPRGVLASQGLTAIGVPDEPTVGPRAGIVRPRVSGVSPVLLTVSAEI